MKRIGRITHSRFYRRQITDRLLYGVDIGIELVWLKQPNIVPQFRGKQYKPASLLRNTIGRTIDNIMPNRIPETFECIDKVSENVLFP